MLSAGSSSASAQTVAGPFGAAAQTVQDAVSTVRAVTTSAVATVTGSVIQDLSDQLAPLVSAIHAYDVDAALTYVKNGDILPHDQE